jgi:riboflavin synthase
VVRIAVERPLEFSDLKSGDSICTNGVCLTLESFDGEQMRFALGAETLQLTNWSALNLKESRFNLERSLRYGDRIHGHAVSGHVDATGEVALLRDLGGSLELEVKVPERLLPFVWKKGSWAVNGVSLTVNSVNSNVVGMCLIPETLKRTNLSALKVGDKVNLEIDMIARGLVNYFESHPSLSRALKEGVG